MVVLSSNTAGCNLIFIPLPAFQARLALVIVVTISNAFAAFVFGGAVAVAFVLDVFLAPHDSETKKYSDERCLNPHDCVFIVVDDECLFCFLWEQGRELSCFSFAEGNGNRFKSPNTHNSMGSATRSL
jgi:hypothetical protein